MENQKQISKTLHLPTSQPCSHLRATETQRVSYLETPMETSSPLVWKSRDYRSLSASKSSVDYIDDVMGLPSFCNYGMIASITLCAVQKHQLINQFVETCMWACFNEHICLSVIIVAVIVGGVVEQFVAIPIEE